MLPNLNAGLQFLNSEIQMNKYSARLLSPSVVGDYFNMNSARLLSPSVVGDYFNMNSACLLSSSVVGDCFNMEWQPLEAALTNVHD